MTIETEAVRKGRRTAQETRSSALQCAYTPEMPVSREIEVKLPARDVPAIVRRLQAMGARPVARIFEQNALFDTPDEYFRRHQSILRIRVEEHAGQGWKPQRRKSRKPACEGLLTFKCPAESSGKRRHVAQTRYKERLEIEYQLPDARRFGRLLERLGLRSWFQYEKYRTHFRIAGSALHIDLDETPIGTFLELEGPRKAIDHVARALGYSARDYITASYLELYAAECDRRRVPVADMVFSARKNAN